jgi:hypothetical protein
MKIIDEIKQNSVSVAWNYGFDSVIFINKSVDGKKSLEDILREHLEAYKD